MFIGDAINFDSTEAKFAEIHGKAPHFRIFAGAPHLLPNEEFGPYRNCDSAHRHERRYASSTSD
jgi:hypothetical protein